MTLNERVRHRLRMVWLALRMKPIAGADEANGDEGNGNEGNGDEGGRGDDKRARSPDKPPWGDDDKFDPERAWRLVRDVRADAARAKAERDELAKKVKATDDATKSEQEKLEERAVGAEGRAAKAETDAARLRVAVRKGLSETLAGRLVGESEEDLETDADKLLDELRGGKDDKTPRGRPREPLRSGAAPAASDEQDDMDGLIRRAAGRR